MVALAVMLRFAAAEVHHALEHDHHPEEQCEICLVVERGGSGLPLAGGHSALAPDWPVPPLPASDHAGTSSRPCPPARGPPALLA